MPDTPPPPSPIPLPVVIDSDPGIDDALALWLALHSPELDVRGISVSYGNTIVEHAYRNAVELLRRADKRVTLAIGARRPLKRPLAVAIETHGPSGLGYAQLPDAGLALDFVRPLERLLAEQPEPVVLVTLGPLTSLARAVRADADLVRGKVARHVAMAGNVGAAGNTTPYSEFNVWCDPEAADIVLRAELGTELVGLDVTRRVVVSGAEVEALGREEAPQARWFADALRFYVEFHRTYERLNGCVVNDVLPIAALIRPDVLSFETQHMVVDLEAGDHRGHTRLDPAGAALSVATSVRPEPARALLFERVLPWAASPAETPVP